MLNNRIIDKYNKLRYKNTKNYTFENEICIKIKNTYIHILGGVMP